MLEMRGDLAFVPGRAVEATSSANLARLQQIISRNIEGFARREDLKVMWVEG
jgi:hypothetical protein